jgi:type III secretion protein L
MSLHLLDQHLLRRAVTKVVKRADYEKVIAAQDVLASAQDAAASQQIHLETLRQEATRAGYTAGIEMGKQAWAQELAVRHQAQQTQLRGMEQVLVDVVMSSLRHLLGELPAGDTFPLLAQQVVQSVVRARQLRLVVTADDAPSARMVLDRWQRQNPDVLAVDVVVDSGLSSGDCVLETDEGAVDGRLSQRLVTIEAVLRRHLSAVASGESSGVASAASDHHKIPGDVSGPQENSLPLPSGLGIHAGPDTKRQGGGRP